MEEEDIESVNVVTDQKTHIHQREEVEEDLDQADLTALIEEIEREITAIAKRDKVLTHRKISTQIEVNLMIQEIQKVEIAEEVEIEDQRVVITKIEDQVVR